jgi:polar amino acid transport system ATP-binding protein
MTLLAVRGLHKKSGNDVRYSNIEFECGAREIVVLIGPSGGGKSSLLRGISGVELPDGGRVVIDGRPVFDSQFETSSGFDGVYPTITMLFQDFRLYPHFKIRQNISLPGAGNGKGPNLGLDKLLDVLEIKALLDKYPHQLSVGQRQRAALARAFSLQPRVLLLDEPTSAQDVGNTKRITDLIREFRDLGGAVIFATHQLGLVRHLATKVLFISNGECVDSGGPDILAAPETDELREFLEVWNSGELQ